LEADTLKSFFFLRGDLVAIKRISVEFCEDVANNGVLYVEARFCPHLMLNEKNPEVTARHVVIAVLEGFQTGEQLYGVKVKTYN
jgi:adenosine deaminase